MNLFDFLIDELLEGLRIAIYRRANRNAPARRSRRSDMAAQAEAKVTRRSRRRRGGLNPLLLVGIIIVGGLVLRRLMKQRG